MAQADLSQGRRPAEVVHAGGGGDDGLFDEISRESYAVTIAKATGDDASSDKQPLQTPRLGTLGGVYFPCLQSILGVTLFLRMPWVTSQGGVFLTCILFVLCQSVAYLTTLSICALVTNGKIAAGGVYFLLSHTLGVETGSAVGLLAFAGSTCSLAFSVLGATEIFKNIVDTSEWLVNDSRVLAVALLVVLSALSAVGLKYITMVGTACLTVVLSSIAAAVVGLLVHATRTPLPSDVVWFDNVHTNYSIDPKTGVMPSMSMLVSLVYPGTTGYMSGAMRASTLENPARSIPLGTIAAMLTVLAINFAVVFCYGSIMSHETLQSDKLIMSTLALPHKQLVNVGILFSAIGGALQSLANQPRMLAAMANDNIIPFLRPFAVKEGQEPRLAIVLCMCLTCIPCFAGNLDYLSPFLTMVSLMQCLTLNLACFAASAAHTPGFRPQWRYFHWTTALVGAMWCFGLMMFFSWLRAVGAIAICIALRIYVKYLGVEQDWGNSVRGMQLELACTLLKMLHTTTEEEHTKNWRPQVLVFCKMDSTGLPLSPQILHFASQLKEGHGLVEVVGLVPRNDDKSYDECQAATVVLRQHLATARLSAFGHVYACKDPLETMAMVAEASGMGCLRTNTVMVGWPNTWESGDAAPYVDMLHDMINCKKSVMVLKNMETLPFNDAKKNGYMDVWWVLHDGGLLLLVPYLLRLHRVWRKCKLRLFAIVSAKENAAEVESRLKTFLGHARIQAEIHVVELSDSTICSMAPKRTGEELNSKKNAIDRMKVATLSFSVRNPSQYSQLTDELNDIGSFVEDGDDDEAPTVLSPRKSKPPLPKGYVSVDPRMRHAQRFNRQLQLQSAQASLVVMNLPRLIGIPPLDFMHYVEALTENLSSVVLIRGSGREVVTLNA
ncbi:hypothetical protein, variant [Aphanomyces invadans]|uniref:SLC12A transporter C-terminal domain-containing protein n=1 Tax=Aphanomyces invadans TaxID=157072 RepID=A0A024TSP1_9STRA|nr:hypothetical protein, variant [Aphanomyces invadans]ETV97038.1 hypothetical protein, variant [Aphanomyces invadans]|eukprot:XP_008874284.1 hypothetical protein, variant [Aphanomyces invadans]